MCAPEPPNTPTTHPHKRLLDHETHRLLDPQAHHLRPRASPQRSEPAAERVGRGSQSGGRGMAHRRTRFCCVFLSARLFDQNVSPLVVGSPCLDLSHPHSRRYEVPPGLGERARLLALLDRRWSFFSPLGSAQKPRSTRSLARLPHTPLSNPCGRCCDGGRHGGSRKNPVPLGTSQLPRPPRTPTKPLLSPSCFFLAGPKH